MMARSSAAKSISGPTPGRCGPSRLWSIALPINTLWAFAHFPDIQHGEWTQKLDRQGNKINDVIALPVKDPYHLPRGLIIAIETLEKLTK